MPLPAALGFSRPGLARLAVILALSDHRVGGLGGIVRARLFWPIVIGFALTACAFQRAQIANDARINMIGLSKERVLACMGPPMNQDAKGTTEVWSYNSENNVTPAGDGNGRYCTVNVKMWNGRVGAVDYSGPAGGLITFNEACALAIEKCAKP
jgi:hypothetical protein